jgi:acetyltransferase-like isoleucine patch superfamily enzyme
MWTRPYLEHGKITKWHWVVLHPEKFQFGEFTDIGAFTLIQAERGVCIEDEVQMGAHCCIYSVDSEGGRCGSVYIGKGAKIGSHCSIMPGVRIGAWAVIGAHSFVNSDIPSRALAYGVPAKVVKENYASYIEGEGSGIGRWVRISGKYDCDEDGRGGGGCSTG